MGAKTPLTTPVKLDAENSNLSENSTMQWNGELLHDKHNITTVLNFNWLLLTVANLDTNFSY